MDTAKPDPVSSVQPIEGLGAMASRLFSTPTKSKTTPGPLVTDPQPKLRQLSLRACLRSATPSTPEKPKRQYTARGTGGTFGGKRPPKKVHARADFEKRRDAHQWSLQAKKDRPKKVDTKPYADRAYHKFVKEMLPLETEGSTRDRFRKVVQKWKSQMTSVDEAIERVAGNTSVM